MENKLSQQEENVMLYATYNILYVNDVACNLIKELVYELQGRYPGLKARVFGSMQRLPLPEWGPVEHRRRPLPEEIGDE